MKALAIRLFLVFCMLLCPLSLRAQQQTQQPLMGSQAEPEQIVVSPQATDAVVEDDGVYRILVVGDNLAGGLGAGMSRMVQDDLRYEIINRFNESSGLARTEVYDWPNAIEKIVSEKPINAVVVLVGVNDRQDIRDATGRFAFKSAEWVKGYEANIGRLLNTVNAAKAKIFWVSIPPMADAGFDTDMRYLADIQAKGVAAAGGHFVDVRPSFVGPDGRYTDRGPDDTGAERKLRSRDGVTFFKQGNNRFGQLVMAEINRITAAAPAAAAQAGLPAAGSAAKPKPEAARTAATGAPVFGQDGLDGEQITFRAEIVRPVAPLPQSAAQRAALNSALPKVEAKFSAKPGSRAERLYVEGTAAAAPAGRFDDFSVPVAQ